jgi:hypothetical protein
MFLILQTSVILDDGVTSDAFFCDSPYPTFVVLVTTVHDDVSAIRNTVYRNRTKSYYVTLYLGTASLCNFYTGTFNISYLEAQD